MSGRRQARSWAVQCLFQRDFNREDIEDGIEHFWSSVEVGGKGRDFTEELVRGVENHREAIDEHIVKFAKNWSLDRMSAVDRNVMRVALFEMLYRPDIPPVVSINEAVEIAKELSGSESGKFVNGILDRARKDLDRPARSAVTDEHVPNLGDT